MMMKLVLGAVALLMTAPARAETLPPISYTVDASGPASDEHPTRGSAVKVRYEGRFADGKVFDSSAKEEGGATIFPLGRLIPGWVAVVPLMKRGDIWTVVLPPPFAYGAAGKGPIPPGATLTFRIELVDFAPMPPTPSEPMKTLPGR